jgi:hypothetical protein
MINVREVEIQIFSSDPAPDLEPNENPELLLNQVVQLVWVELGCLSPTCLNSVGDIHLNIWLKVSASIFERVDTVKTFPVQRQPIFLEAMLVGQK